MNLPKVIYLNFALLLFLVGCSSPKGSSWVSADFNKYDLNYENFRTSSLKVGDNKSLVIQGLGINYETIEAGSNYEVLAFQQWVSVPGPDYVGSILYIRFENNKLTKWKITRDTISIVPRTW
jgi:hypothetical protein